MKDINPMTIEEVEFIIEKILPWKFLVPYGFTGEFNQNFKEELKLAVHSLFQKEKRKTFPIHFMKLTLL